VADMQDRDIEIQNEKNSDPEQFEDSVTTAGTPETITPSTGNIIQMALVQNPHKGKNKNNPNDVLYVNIDGSSTTFTVAYGEAIPFSGVYSTLSIDSNNNGVNYEVILWS